MQDNANAFYIQFEKSLCQFRSVQFLFKSFQGNLKAAIGNSSFPRAIQNRQRQLNRLGGPFMHIKLSLILSRPREYQSALGSDIPLKYEFKDAQGSIIKVIWDI